MSDTDLVLDEHRPAADGSRPLQVGQKMRGLSAELLEDAPPRECWSVRQARYLSKGGVAYAPPLHCRLMVVPGDHFILWTERDVGGRPTGRTEAYCAPCAIAEWDVYQVTEASL